MTDWACVSLSPGSDDADRTGRSLEDAGRTKTCAVRTGPSLNRVQPMNRDTDGFSSFSLEHSSIALD